MVSHPCIFRKEPCCQTFRARSTIASVDCMLLAAHMCRRKGYVVRLQAQLTHADIVLRETLCETSSVNVIIEVSKEEYLLVVRPPSCDLGSDLIVKDRARRSEVALWLEVPLVLLKNCSAFTVFRSSTRTVSDDHPCNCVPVAKQYPAPTA